MTGRTGTTEVLFHLLVSQLGTERLSREETAPGSTAGSAVTCLWVCGLVGDFHLGAGDPLFPFSACSEEGRGGDSPLCDPNAVFSLPL